MVSCVLSPAQLGSGPAAGSAGWPASCRVQAPLQARLSGSGQEALCSACPAHNCPTHIQLLLVPFTPAQVYLMSLASSDPAHAVVAHQAKQLAEQLQRFAQQQSLVRQAQVRGRTAGRVTVY